MRFQTRVPLGVVFCALLALAACGGGGGGDASEDSEDLYVVEFALIDQVGSPTGATGTTNAYRNNRLRFTYSETLDPASVSDRTIPIGIPSGTNLFLQAIGQYRVDGNRVIFDPSVTPSGGPHPFGFEPDSTYSVFVKGHPESKTVQSHVGDPVATSFTTTFTTTDRYLPDLDQPRAVDATPPGLDSNQVAELTQMTPEERVADNDATGRWEPLWIESRADVVVEFSEAMNPATFDPASSFRVINLDRNNRDVLGIYKFSDDARTVTFRPTFGYGRGPYLIEVTLSVDLTDLAGNPISNPRKWIFLTEYDPTAVNEGLIEEYFDDNAFEDTAFSPPGAEGIAKWNPMSDPGMLASTFGNRTLTVPTAPGGSSNYIPMGGLSWISCRFQSWYKPGEMGQPGTISGLSFPVGSVMTPNCIYTNFIVQIGHSSKNLTPGAFANNLNVGTPVTVINGVTWTMPGSLSMNQWVAFPAMTKSFGFNGTNNVVIDVGKATTTGSGNTWSCRSGFDGNVRRIWNTSQSSSSSSGSDTGYTYPYLVSFRTESSMARSLWFETESDAPVYLEAIVNPTDQPPGTETMVEYQGTHDDGSGVPDPAEVSAWTQDVADLDGFQYLRFRTTFKANLGTGVGPKLEDIVVPYIFF